MPNVAKCWACVSAIFCERRASATHAAAAVQYPPPGAAATPSRTDTEGLAQGTGPQCASDGTEAGAEQSQIVCSSTLKRPWINADADDAPGKRLRAEAVVPVCPERAIACAAVGSAGGYDMGLQEEDTAKLFTFQGVLCLSQCLMNLLSGMCGSNVMAPEYAHTQQTQCARAHAHTHTHTHTNETLREHAHCAQPSATSCARFCARLRELGSRGCLSRALLRVVFRQYHSM